MIVEIVLEEDGNDWHVGGIVGVVFSKGLSEARDVPLVGGNVGHIDDNGRVGVVVLAVANDITDVSRRAGYVRVLRSGPNKRF